MDNPRIAHVSYADASTEGKLSVLAGIYALAIQKYKESQRAAEPTPEPDSHHALKTSANEKRRLT